MEIVDSIKKHEGFESKPYIDPLAYSGIPLDEYAIIKKNWNRLKVNYRVHDTRYKLNDRLPVLKRLSKNRQDVLVEMTYQMGIDGLLKFKNMIQALVGKNYDRASREMLDSIWARQTPERAKELANKMLKG